MQNFHTFLILIAICQLTKTRLYEAVPSLHDPQTGYQISKTKSKPVVILGGRIIPLKSP